MVNRLSTIVAVAAFVFVSTGIPDARGDCPLDHYFLIQESGQLFVDKVRIYQHGDPAEGCYPLTWSAVYGCWSVGEPGFSDASDPAYGFPPEVQLEGTPNVDYQIWFEVLDISPDLYLQTDDGTWLYEVGDRYNLSNWPEHHVHMHYRAYVDQNPPPDYPFHVTYRLVDEFGGYEPTAPFSVVLNMPAPTVEQTAPAYRGTLESLADARITLTFHREITVVGGPPVTITDEETQTEDYFTDYFDYDISPDGLTLILNQVGPALLADTWLEISLTEHLQDADIVGQPAIPFTLFVQTPEEVQIPGDLDGDGDVDLADLAQLLAHYGETSGMTYEDGDLDGDGDVDLADLAELLGHYGRSCDCS